MKFERENLIESPERQELRVLEESGLYVFHGTHVDTEGLEPRQAIDTETGPDDVPGVHASQVADMAIFVAVAGQLGNIRFGADEVGERLAIDYGISSTDAEKLNDETNGFVYVFDRKDFIQRRPAEWLSTKSVKPVRKIQVFRRDLPRDIKIF